jgi:hypothetical protein
MCSLVSVGIKPVRHTNKMRYPSCCEIKSRIAMAKAAFNKKKNLFYQKIGLKFEEETSEVLRLEHSSVWC